MTLWKLGLAAIAFLMMGIWYIPATIWGLQVTKASSEMVSGDGSAMGTLLKGPAPLSLLRDKRTERNFFSPDELTKRRYVSITHVVPFSELLAPGELQPDPAFHQLYATARAPGILMRYCPEILGKMATKCGVLIYEADFTRDGLVEISGSLSYVPAYEMGDLSKVNNGEVILARSRILRDQDMENTKETRALAITEALALCAELRGSVGPCVISNLNISSRRNRHDREAPPMIDARVSFAVYADKTQHRHESLNARLEEIVGG